MLFMLVLMLTVDINTNWSSVSTNIFHFGKDNNLLLESSVFVYKLERRGTFFVVSSLHFPVMWTSMLGPPITTNDSVMILVLFVGPEQESLSRLVLEI